MGLTFIEMLVLFTCEKVKMFLVRRLMGFVKAYSDNQTCYGVESCKGNPTHVFRAVAQLVEQRSPKPQVAGSSPVRPAKQYTTGSWKVNIQGGTKNS